MGAWWAAWWLIAAQPQTPPSPMARFTYHHSTLQGACSAALLLSRNRHHAQLRALPLFPGQNR